MQKIKDVIKNPLTYKIFVDIFLLLMVVTVAFVLVETFIPGILSAYISPFTLFIASFVAIIFISIISHKIDTKADIKPHKKISAIFISILFAILIGIAGYKYGFFFDSIVVIFSIVTFVLLHHLVKDMIRN
jgi:hypothetical protein